MDMRVRVNDTDYKDFSGKTIVVIEQWSLDEKEGWVPAWEEIGLGDLEGDTPEYSTSGNFIGFYWSSRPEAQKAIDEARRNGEI
jgi:hypothetical protein